MSDTGHTLDTKKKITKYSTIPLSISIWIKLQRGETGLCVGLGSLSSLNYKDALKGAKVFFARKDFLCKYYITNTQPRQV